MLAQITKSERNSATVLTRAPQEKELRVLIPYDGSETAEATLTALSRAGLPSQLDALVAVTQVWLPLSPYEITKAVNDRRLKLLSSGLSSHVPALLDHEEQRVLSLEAQRKLRSMFPVGRVKTEAIDDTAALAQAILLKAKRWDADLIIIGSQMSPSSQITDYVGPALRIAEEADCSVRIARPCDRKVDSSIQIIVCVDERSSSDKVIDAVCKRIWPTGTIANIVMTRKPGPRHVTRDAEAAEVLDAWADRLRATGLEVSIATEDGRPEVLLQKSQQSWVDCVFVDPHHGQDDGLDESRLSEVARAVILGAKCSVEVIRAKSSNDQYLEPAA